MWKLVQDELTPLEQVCREELAGEQAGERVDKILKENSTLAEHAYIQ
jgi:hypothetical protein